MSKDKKEMKKVWPIVLKAPLVIFLLVTWGVSFYAAYNEIGGITWGAPTVFTVFIGLYIAGVIIQRKVK